jgi:hypothetical protein
MSRTLDSETIRRMIALGLEDTTLLIKAAEFVERRPEGFDDLNSLLSGFEAPGATPFNEAFPIIMNALVPERKEAANDRVRRFNSAERTKIYSNLCERDDEQCAQCGCDAATIWRRMGLYCTEENWQYTKVWPTSNLEIDHRVPLWAGGDNDESNLWLLCVDCHKRKTAQEASQRRRA